jgi:hypothetical protein
MGKLISSQIKSPMTMNSKSILRAVLFTVAGMLLGTGIALAQNCMANAGGTTTVSTTILTGGISGTVGAGNPN